jgi:hypothetical protein
MIDELTKSQRSCHRLASAVKQSYHMPSCLIAAEHAAEVRTPSTAVPPELLGLCMGARPKHGPNALLPAPSGQVSNAASELAASRHAATIILLNQRLEKHRMPKP